VGLPLYKKKVTGWIGTPREDELLSEVWD